MTLPTGGAWPPPPHGVALAQMSLWNAWMVGDPDGLRQVYSDLDSSSATAESSFAPKPGIVNRVASFFWSRPSASGQRRERLHVPMAADIATASADLLFSEPPQFVLDEDGNEAAKERVDELLNCGSFHAELVEAAEIAAGLGGGWLRLVWDTEVADHVLVDAVAADAAIGEWQWNALRAVTFFTEYRRKATDQEVIRHLERHEPGRVLHGLYVGTTKELGRSVPLADHPDTEPYAELIDEEGAIATGVKGLTAAYVANMRPQRRWRKIPGIAELGRSDYDGVEPLMDALDECYSSWMRDVRLGKARILVPEFMLQDLGKGSGAAFDVDQEIFTQLKMSPSTGVKDGITPQQFAIRVAEHAQTAEALVDEILDAAGYSASTFGRGQESAVTATEVVSRERKSDRTRDKKTRYWSQALEPFLTTWLELDALVFATGAAGSVKVQWADASQPDPEVLARTTETLNRAAAVSVDTKVRMLHPDWDEEQIAAEVKAIQAETGVLVPDLGPLPPPSPTTEPRS